MKRNILLSILLAVILLGSPLYAFSNKSSEGAMNAFSRYEPDFANAMRRLEELDRRFATMDKEADASLIADIKDAAEETMNRIQKRYDLMEDLFTTTSGDYPADRAELFEGFTRLDDLYRGIRDFYTEKFVYRDQKAGEKTGGEPTASPVTPTSEVAAPTAEPVEPAAASATADQAPLVAEPAAALPEASTTRVKDNNKLELSGVLKLDFRNRNEVYRTQNNALPFVTAESALPNNLRQGKLGLTYKYDDMHELFVEDRFLKRERNEPVHENYLTLAYLFKETQDRAWTIKNTLQHSWYPEAGSKDYRNNLAELFFNDRWTRRERLANLGYQTRTYPNYSRSDFHQLNFGDQETWFRKDGSMFLEFKSNWRRYNNVDDLDYNNANVYGEYSKSYSGNKAELSLSDTYDRRIYDQESINLYRTSYYDNYFRLNYELPVHDKLTYAFEGQHTIRNYGADAPRGYKELNLFSVARFKIDSDTRAQADYRYVNNDENTRERAHTNHKLHGMWQKSYSKDFRVKVEDTMHLRNAPDENGKEMEFRENLFNAKLSWNLKNSMNLTWNNEYLSRIYERLGYRDFKYFLSGVALSYASAQKYDWKLEQSWRKFDFRNGAINTGWEGESQPITEVQYNRTLRADLKLRLKATWEKSYYRTFDADSQELLWDFTRPMTITEFYGGLEYMF